MPAAAVRESLLTLLSSNDTALRAAGAAERLARFIVQQLLDAPVALPSAAVHVSTPSSVLDADRLAALLAIEGGSDCDEQPQMAESERLLTWTDFCRSTALPVLQRTELAGSAAANCVLRVLERARSHWNTDAECLQALADVLRASVPVPSDRRGNLTVELLDDYARRRRLRQALTGELAPSTASARQSVARGVDVCVLTCDELRELYEEIGSGLLAARLCQAQWASAAHARYAVAQWIAAENAIVSHNIENDARVSSAVECAARMLLRFKAECVGELLVPLLAWTNRARPVRIATSLYDELCEALADEPAREILMRKFVKI